MAGISHVYTIAGVAEMLGVDEDLLHDLSIAMDPEDGRLAVLGAGDESMTAFTAHGIDCLRQIIADLQLKK